MVGLDSLVPFDSRNKVGVNGVKRKGWRLHYSYHLVGKVGQVPRPVHSFGGVAICISAYVSRRRGPKFMKGDGYWMQEP